MDKLQQLKLEVQKLLDDSRKRVHGFSPEAAEYTNGKEAGYEAVLDLIAEVETK